MKETGTLLQDHRPRGRRILRVTFALLALAGLLNATADGEETGDWAFPQMRPLRVRVLRGLWHEQYRIEEAVARRGGGVLADSWDSGGGGGSGWLAPGNQGGGWVWYFPGNRAGLLESHLIVVCNINATSFRNAAKPLVEYVRNGGAVLFLGGRWAFGRAYRNSPLAEICPVEFPGQGRWQGSDLEFRPEGVALAPGTHTIGPGFGSLPWQRGPRLFWYHNVKPKENAKVLLAAGDSPILVAGESGKGRVAVFAGTVMGDPREGQLAFWDWNGWPQILALTMDWLAEAPARAEHGLSAGSRAAVDALLEPGDPFEEVLAEEEPNPQQAMTLNNAATACRDRESTLFLLKALGAMKGNIPCHVAEELGVAAVSFADKTFVAPAWKLVGSGLPYKTALGLRVIGACRVDGAHEILAKFHASGKPEAGLDDPSNTQTNVVIPSEAEDRRLAIRLGALAGLGHLGSSEALAKLRAALREHNPGKPAPEAYLDTLGNDNMLYQETLLAMLRCGDGSAAGPVVDMLMENIYLVARARTEANKSDERLERIHAAIPRALTWQQRLYHELNIVPDTVLPELARRIAAEADRRVIAIALAAFADRPLPEEVKEILLSSPHAPVAALAQ